MSPQVSLTVNKRLHRKVGETECTCSFALEMGTAALGLLIRDPVHTIVQSKPTPPVTRKIQRQPARRRIAAIRGGAITAPTEVPALMIPIAVARSPVGKY